MHQYRTHHCAQLRLEDSGNLVRISGWVHRMRDHGGLLFIDLRDNFGLTQCVIDTDHAQFALCEGLSVESVLSITGKVVQRTQDTINPELPTGAVEIAISEVAVLAAAETLPMPVNQDAGYPEEYRLKYRFLDLRREELHKKILLRSHIIASLRTRMQDRGFVEFQTPILTATSPEGARDFLVPSRLHPGKFYALPQAPQQFKQLLMIAGFDRYFQIAPCFRDEDARADRSPGEFYQLDLEMAFVTQEDVFAALEPVLHGLFEEFAKDRTVSPYPFQRIPYHQAMQDYGTDKPDLRNPLRIRAVTEAFEDSGFGLFAKAIAKGAVVKAIKAPKAAAQPRSWFDKLNEWARAEGQGGLGYIGFRENGPSGPIAKNLDAGALHKIRGICEISTGDAVFFVCGKEGDATKFAGVVRTRLAEELELIDAGELVFCWIVDFPMYERDDTGGIEFSHNPFSMPQGGLEALEEKDPLDILAWQYDIVCNGVELSSGAIRNHRPDIMLKAFAIAGYDQAFVEENFAGMINALRFGAPPHGGSAPGIDRMVMLLADAPNIREITAFPMNQMAQDLMMGAPAAVSVQQLRDIHIKLDLPKEDSRDDTK
ncbi:MAG: aspartate--tRNA ligase [Pseudomonadota bacterium]